MPRLFTVGDLVQRGIRRADKEGDGHIAPDEWKALLSEAVGELYELAIEAGMRIGESLQTITIAGELAAYDLEDDHLETLSIELVRPGGERVLLQEAAAQERHALSQPNNASGERESHFYSIIDSQIVLFRTPAEGDVYEHIFLRQPPNLSVAEDADQVDLFCPSGESFVAWCLAVFGKDKSEVDLQVALREKERAAARFRTWAQNQRSPLAPKQRFVQERHELDDYRRRRIW